MVQLFLLHAVPPLSIFCVNYDEVFLLVNSAHTDHSHQSNFLGLEKKPFLCLLASRDHHSTNVIAPSGLRLLLTRCKHDSYTLRLCIRNFWSVISAKKQNSPLSIYTSTQRPRYSWQDNKNSIHEVVMTTKWSLLRALRSPSTVKCDCRYQGKSSRTFRSNNPSLPA